MKTAILTSAMIILMATANALPLADTNNLTGSPEQIFQASVTQVDNNIIRFNVKNPGEDKVVLKIYSDNMVKVFQRTGKNKKQLNLGCDLTNLDSGIYTFIVKRNGKEELKKQKP